MGCGSNKPVSSPTTGVVKEELHEQDGGRKKYNKAKDEVLDGEDEYGCHPDEDNFGEDKAEGEKTMAVRPAMGAIMKPTNCKDFNPNPPTLKYNLEYVYGYRCEDSRQNLFYTADNKVVFMTAALGVVLDPTSNTQTFFGGKSTDSASKFKTNGGKQHTDDILALAISEDRKLVVTGQVGQTPIVYTWDAATKEVKDSVRLPKGTRGVSALSFSFDGKYYALADKHNDHNVYVAEVGKNMAGSLGKGGNNAVNDVAFSKKPGDYRFVVCGKNNATFWDVNDKASGSKNAIFGEKYRDLKHDFTCATWDNTGRCYLGGLDGSIFIFEDGKCINVVQVHKGAVQTINFCEGSILSGGMDKTVKIMKTDLSPINSITTVSCPRAIDMKDGKILAGLRDGTITELTKTGSTKDLLYSHSNGEVWGLALANNMVVTTGDDNKVMTWDYKQRRKVAIAKINEVPGEKIKYGASTLSTLPDNQCSRSVVINKKNGHVAVATNAGEVQIRKSIASIGEVVKKLPCGERWIEIMAYSPCGKYLAVGNHVQKILVFTVDDGYNSYATLSGHSSFILGLDWSTDSKFIRTNCGAYELLFWDVEKKCQDKSGASNTVGKDWASYSCKISYNSLGMFPPSEDCTHINTVSISNDGNYLINGDDWGLVNIYHNPVPDKSDGKCISLRGHSEHVMRVTFNDDDSYIFSVGGYDQTLMQWKKE